MSNMLTFHCYEPAGCRVELAESDLVQHVLLAGSTGSGKSTLLNSAIDQLVGFKFGSREPRIGLLVLDAKADDLVARVKQASQLAGRADDVLVFGPDGSYALDLFGGLRSLDDVDRITRSVMLGTERFGVDNHFWWQSSATMLNAAFTLLVASGRTITFASTVEFLRSWFLTPETPAAVAELARDLNARGGDREPMLAAALNQVQLWQSLDSRTRSNLQSCLMNLLQPLLSPSATRCFHPRDGTTGNPAQAATGKICVVSINAPAEPDLARFIFRLAKQSFFNAVQQRKTSPGLCGLVADELPLVVTREDVEQVATIRSKRCFVLAATQGFHALSERIGVGETRALANNFNTTIYMRSREAETAVQAFLALGVRRERLPRRPRDEGGLLGLMQVPSAEPASVEVPVCPMGALGQLSPHQAFISFGDGRRTETPVWFVPWFEQGQDVPIRVIPAKNTAAHLQEIMIRAGFKRLWPPQMVMHAAAFNRHRRRKTLQRAKTFFLSKCCLVPEGLDSLPDCWLAALPGILWSTRKKHWTKLPYFVSRLSVADGYLVVEFAQETPEAGDRVTAWDRLRIAINASLYPSRWRPLNRWHQVKLRQFHPEVCAFLDGPKPEIS